MATLPRHWMRNALAHAGIKKAANAIRPDQHLLRNGTVESAHKKWCIVADQLRVKFPKLASLLDESETDVLAFVAFPKAHRKQQDRVDVPAIGLTHEFSAMMLGTRSDPE